MLEADERIGRIFRKAPMYTPARITSPPARNEGVMRSPVRTAASETVTSGSSNVMYDTAEAVQRSSGKTYRANITTEPKRIRDAIAAHVPGWLGSGRASLAARERANRRPRSASLASAVVKKGTM